MYTFSSYIESFIVLAAFVMFFFLSFVVRLTQISDESQLSWPQNPNRSEYILAFVIQWITAKKEKNNCLLYKSNVVPDYSIFLTVKIIPVYSNLFPVFFYLPALSCILSNTHCFPQKLFEILILEVTSTGVLQRQENKLTEPYRRICLPIKCFCRQNVFFKLLAGLYKLVIHLACQVTFHFS